MTLDQLFAVFIGNIVDIENALFPFDLSVENHLHQNIAKLLTKHIGIVLVDRFNRFICLLDEIFLNALVSLLDVPRTAVLGAKNSHNLNKVVNIVFFFKFKTVFHIHIILT